MKRITRTVGLVLLAAVALLATATTATAQIKVGVADADVILAQMSEFQDIQQQLQAAGENIQTEYQQKLTSLQEDFADYQKKQALLSAEARTAREERLAAGQTELQQFLQLKDQELAQQQAELLSPLFEKVQGAIDEVAAEKGLDLVLSPQTSAGAVVLYASDELDITIDVARKLGITVPEGADSE